MCISRCLYQIMFRLLGLWVDGSFVFVFRERCIKRARAISVH